MPDTEKEMNQVKIEGSIEEKLIKMQTIPGVESVREAGAERGFWLLEITEQAGLISCLCWCVSVLLL